MSRTEAAFHLSLLPPAAELERIESLLPGATERLMALLEEQARHRMSLESTNLKDEGRRANRGLLAALGLSALTLIIAGGLVALGHDEAGTAIAGINIVGLAAAFIYGTASRKSERLEKAKILKE